MIRAISAAAAFGLHLRGSTRSWFMGWLARSRPESLGHYRQLYGRGAYLPASYRDELRERVTPLIAKHGLTGEQRSFRMASVPPPVAADPQPTLF